MNELLSEVIDAHGGLTRWNGFSRVDAKIVSGGGFFALKGLQQDQRSPPDDGLAARRAVSSVLPYGAPDQRTVVHSGSNRMVKLDGKVVAERELPEDSFAGHRMSAAASLFQWRGPVELSHDALHERSWGGRNRGLARGSRDMARAARLLPGIDRNAQLDSGLLLRRRPAAAPSRLQCKSRVAADLELCDRKWDYASD